MKLQLLALLLISFALSASAQNLTLAELQNLCKLSNWETGAQTLSRKGWEYHDSKRGSSWQYSIISYAHSKDDYYEDRAAAWFTFYTYDNRVDKIHYTPPNRTAYNNIVATLAANGYKRVDNQINDDNITVTYSSPSFTLEIKTETTKHAYNSTTFETNRIYLTRKGGIYDDDNGEKVEYWYSGGIKERYTLKDGKKNGKCTTYYSDGTLESIFTYVNGNLTGAFAVYNSDGVLQGAGTLLNGKKNGLITKYHEDGNKQSECVYKNDVRNGKETTYFPNGKIHTIGNYVNDQMSGLCKLFNEEGTLLVSGTYLNGKEHGLVTVYNENGIKESEITYQNGVSNGKYTLYHPNGKVKETGSNLDDEVNGLVTEYNEDGIKISEETFKNGEYDGKVTLYNEDGKIEVTGTYVNGKKNGTFTEYTYDDDDGHLWMQEIDNYIDDDLHGYCETKVFSNDKWRTILYKNYDHGTLHGAAKNWNTGADTVIFCNYNHGKLDGEYKVKGVFMNLGNILAVDDDNLLTLTDGQYSDGSRVGYWIYKNSMGRITSEGLYQSGKREGEWRFYKVCLGEWKYNEDSLFSSEFNMQISSIENYNNGLLHGKLTKFRDKNPYSAFKDSVDYIATYRNGQLDGHYERHTPDGDITISGDYTNGKKSGKWHELDSADNTKWVTEYTDNMFNGRREQYDAQDHKLFSYNYSYNTLDGIQTKYNTDGSKQQEERYYMANCNGRTSIRETIAKNCQSKSSAHTPPILQQK